MLFIVILLIVVIVVDNDSREHRIKGYIQNDRNRKVLLFGLLFGKIVV